ncbi:MAG: DUF2156 domain-containing protein [Clostridia bacterium]|nr:DUF2156 domain-containing protein [Clostridia bacterium]
MLKFKNVKIEDIDIYKKFMKNNKEFSCENSFVNLLVWQCAYSNMMAVSDGQLFIKSGTAEKETFRLPVGQDLEKGIKKLVEYNDNKMPSFWLQEGERLSEFQEKYSQQYIFRESRDAADYIYLQSDLANLSGKKYHSKRNHINAFSKKHNWHYEEITQSNIEKVRLCAEKWYKENADKEDSFLLCEKKGIGTMLDNMERLSLKGGAIIVDSNVVAFTLGSAINDTVFDIHIEKALKDFAEAYTVINREFAASLSDYKYINREDDMGLEGLRKAKLSYKPEMILKKYFAKVK